MRGEFRETWLTPGEMGEHERVNRGPLWAGGGVVHVCLMVPSPRGGGEDSVLGLRADLPATTQVTPKGAQGSRKQDLALPGGTEVLGLDSGPCMCFVFPGQEQKGARR